MVFFAIVNMLRRRKTDLFTVVNELMLANTAYKVQKSKPFSFDKHSTYLPFSHNLFSVKSGLLIILVVALI